MPLAAKLLALLLMLTVTVSVAPAFSVSLDFDRVTHACPLAAVQFNAWPPVFVSV